MSFAIQILDVRSNRDPNPSPQIITGLMKDRVVIHIETENSQKMLVKANSQSNLAEAVSSVAAVHSENTQPRTVQQDKRCLSKRCCIFLYSTVLFAGLTMCMVGSSTGNHALLVSGIVCGVVGGVSAFIGCCAEMDID